MFQKKRILQITLIICILVITIIGINYLGKIKNNKNASGNASGNAITNEAVEDEKGLGIPDVSDVKLGDYSNIEISKEKIEITDEELEAAIEEDMQSYGSYEQITDRKVKEGDIINISYVALVDGMENTDETVEDLTVSLGDDNLPEEFEKQLIGMEVGKTQTLKYERTGETDNEVAFDAETTINYICGDYVIPDLTDEFIKDNFSDVLDVEEYKESIKEDLYETKEQEQEDNEDQQIMDKLCEICDAGNIPESNIQAYIDNATDYYTQYAEYLGTTFDEFVENMLGETTEEFNKETREYAIKSVKSEKILKAIAIKEGLKVSETDYNERIEAMVEDYGYETKEDLLKVINETDNEEAVIKDNILINKALELIAKNVTFIEK